MTSKKFSLLCHEVSLTGVCGQVFKVVTAHSTHRFPWNLISPAMTPQHVEMWVLLGGTEFGKEVVNLKFGGGGALQCFHLGIRVPTPWWLQPRKSEHAAILSLNLRKSADFRHLNTALGPGISGSGIVALPDMITRSLEEYEHMSAIGWVVLIMTPFFISAMFYLLLRKPGDEEHPRPLLDGLTVVLSAPLFVVYAFLLILWGLGVDTRESVGLWGAELSADALRAASRTMGVGITTGLVVGAIISLVQRFDEAERGMDWRSYFMNYLRRKR